MPVWTNHSPNSKQNHKLIVSGSSGKFGWNQTSQFLFLKPVKVDFYLLVRSPQRHLCLFGNSTVVGLSMHGRTYDPKGVEFRFMCWIFFFKRFKRGLWYWNSSESSGIAFFTHQPRFRKTICGAGVFPKYFWNTFSVGSLVVKSFA